jgi:hypothetical protein
MQRKNSTGSKGGIESARKRKTIAEIRSTDTSGTKDNKFLRKGSKIKYDPLQAVKEERERLRK